jgi:DNA repair protein RecO (recombination protein O)
VNEARAILLRRYRFSENSLVVVWLTEGHGKVKTAVRSATKPGSPFAGRLELFTEAEIAFKAPKSGDLHSLSEVVVCMDEALPATYPTILAASYFVELCDLLTEPMHPVPEIFLLLRRAWGYLREKSPDRRGVEHFEAELAKVLGIHDPSLPAHRSLASVLSRMPESRERVMTGLR